MSTSKQHSKSDKIKKVMSIIKVMSWMDEKRWLKSRSPGDLGNDCFRDLNPCHQILVHWLCYITDRMRPFEQVWRGGGQVFSEIVAEYTESAKTEEDVLDLFSRAQNIGFMEKPGKNKKAMDIFQSKISNKEYAVRFPDDLYSLVRTLILLLRYKKDLIYYISKNMNLCDKPDKIGRIAFLLYLLSYKDLDKTFHNLSGNERERVLGKVRKYRRALDVSLENFDEEFEKWSSSGRFSNKRLWASLRDYLKFKCFSSFFVSHFSLSKDLDKFLFQLEFPGDVWNKRFANRLLLPIISDEKVKGNKVFIRSNASQTMRRLFQWLKENGVDLKGYYPEQFDVSFDFARRMCENKLCDVCPFGRGALKICFGQKTSVENKYCPVVLVACGYRTPCKKEGCPVIEEIGKGVCARQEVRCSAPSRTPTSQDSPPH